MHWVVLTFYLFNAVCTANNAIFVEKVHVKRLIVKVIKKLSSVNLGIFYIESKNL